MVSFDLKGKRAIVTGAAQGLGKGVAEGYLEAGAKVCLFDVNPKVVEVAKEYADKGYDAVAVVGDVRDDEARSSAFAQAIEALGGLDILVAAAGVQRRHPSVEFPLEDWDFVVDINLRAVFALNQAAAAQFIKQETGGKIINFASMLTYFGGYTVPAYAASKGGVAQLTKAFSNEWARLGINVNAIAPGYMATEMNTALLDPANPRYKTITERIPAQRWGTPDDVKGVTIFLASQASDYLSGAIIPVDGGYLSW
ncbi:SDR family oxidoreductase [Arcanobacterium haemolyticum]|nr:SDR family oxidoreductase [Arcanobacterium haemolyticum]